MMNSEIQRIPGDPASFIRECVDARRIYWTYHVNMRLRLRSIPREWILESTESYEIIECYPDDKYLPSYLVWAKATDAIIHVLFAVDLEDNNVRVVTAYRPNPREWEESMKRRIAV